MRALILGLVASSLALAACGDPASTGLGGRASGKRDGSPSEAEAAAAAAAAGASGAQTTNAAPLPCETGHQLIAEAISSDFAVSAGEIYFVTPKSLKRAPVNGGASTDLVGGDKGGDKTRYGLSADGRAVYFANALLDAEAAELVTLDTNNEPKAVSTTKLVFSQAPILDGEYVYFAGRDTNGTDNDLSDDTLRFFRRTKDLSQPQEELLQTAYTDGVERFDINFAVGSTQLFVSLPDLDKTEDDVQRPSIMYALPKAAGKVLAPKRLLEHGCTAIAAASDKAFCGEGHKVIAVELGAENAMPSFAPVYDKPGSAGKRVVALAVTPTHLFVGDAMGGDKSGVIERLPLAGGTASTQIACKVQGLERMSSDGTYVYFAQNMGGPRKLLRTLPPAP